MIEFLERRKVLLIYIPLIVYWCILLIGTSLPAASVPGFAIGDKFLHLIAYFILAILLALTLIFQSKSPLLKKKFFISTIIISSIYGLLDEIHQGFIPGRSNDILDWFADSVGGLAGALLVYFILSKMGYFIGKQVE